MTGATELTDLSLRAASDLLHRRALSPVELTDYFLDRLDRLEPTLHSMITVAHDHAREAARAAEDAVMRDDEHGPLHGLPLSIKDLVVTKDVRTTHASRLYEDWVPDEDSTVVRRWQEAGTVMLGKLITHEFAFGIQFPGHKFPAARNPWNLDHIPGGSSSGTGAALAAGLVTGATGSDTGGSIRGPAAFCGLAGIKPTVTEVLAFDS